MGDPGGPLAAAGHAGDARRGLRGGAGRLRVLEPLLRYATALRAYGAETAAGALPQASAWVLELPGARVTLGLSPERRGVLGRGRGAASGRGRRCE